MKSSSRRLCPFMYFSSAHVFSLLPNSTLKLDLSCINHTFSCNILLNISIKLSPCLSKKKLNSFQISHILDQRKTPRQLVPACHHYPRDPHNNQLYANFQSIMTMCGLNFKECYGLNLVLFIIY